MVLPAGLGTRFELVVFNACGDAFTAAYETGVARSTAAQERQSTFIVEVVELRYRTTVPNARNDRMSVIHLELDSDSMSLYIDCTAEDRASTIHKFSAMLGQQ